MKTSKHLLCLFSCVALFALTGCSKNLSPMDNYKNQSAKQILFDAEKALSKRSYKDAIKHLEALDALYPFGPEADQAQLDIIYAYYQNDDYPSALAAADRYVHLYPRGEYVPYAYYMKGLVNFESSTGWLQKITHSDPAERDLSGLRTAFASFNELLQQFPDSAYAKDAYKRMIAIRNVLAQHEVEVANFYLIRKAFVAAANRASYVVKHYQGAPVVEDALKIMVEAYKGLGTMKQMQDTIRILNLNYPNWQKDTPKAKYKILNKVL